MNDVNVSDNFIMTQQVFVKCFFDIDQNINGLLFASCILTVKLSLLEN